MGQRRSRERSRQPRLLSTRCWAWSRLAEPATEEGLRRALAVRRARAQEYTTDVAAAGGVSLEALGQRLAAVEDFQDLYLRGGARALEVSDRDYRRHLAQVVAGGLQDDVPLDRTALLLDLLAQIDAKHLLVLRALASAAATGITQYDHQWSPDLEQVAAKARTDLDTAVALLARLRALGLAESHANVRQVILGAARMARSERWWPTKAGRELLAEFRRLPDIDAPPGTAES
jgi:hypothetical protein